MKYNNNAVLKTLDFISEKIRKKEWSYGDKIWTESQLCEFLGISRTSVRHAIEKMVTMSILRKVQGSGTYVEDADKLSILTINPFDFSTDDLLNILYFRLYFEVGNVKMFIENAEESDILQLEDALDNLRINKNNIDIYNAYDSKFHNIIAKGTKNKFVEQIGNLILNTLEQHQQITYRLLGPAPDMEYHELIFKYIKERNMEFASITMQYHIHTAIAAVRNKIDGK